MASNGYFSSGPLRGLPRPTSPSSASNAATPDPSFMNAGAPDVQPPRETLWAHEWSDLYPPSNIERGIIPMSPLQESHSTAEAPDQQTIIPGEASKTPSKKLLLPHILGLLEPRSQRAWMKISRLLLELPHLHLKVSHQAFKCQAQTLSAMITVEIAYAAQMQQAQPPTIPKALVTAGSTPFKGPGTGFVSRVNNNEDYGLGLKGRVTANCQMPLNIDIGLREILVFFPNSVQSPEVSVRLMRNGVPKKQAAKMFLYPMDKVNKKDVLTVENRFKKQWSTGGKMVYKLGKDDEWDQKFTNQAGHQVNLTANNWMPRSQHEGKGGDFVHFKMTDIANAVPRERWPKGSDRLLVTQCLEYAVDHPDQELDTSHWQQLITAHGFQTPAAPAGFLTRDREALQRFMNEVPNPTE